MRRLLLVLLLTSVPANAADTFPIDGLAQPPKMSGFVAIPGCPLPPVQPEAVRNAIYVHKYILSGVRLLGHSVALARGVGFLATLYAAIGEDASADACFAEAEAILHENRDPAKEMGWLYNNYGLVRLNQERPLDAVRYFRSAQAALDRFDEAEWRAKVAQNLGTAYKALGDVDNGESAYLKALEILHKSHLDDSETENTTSANLALLYGSMRDFAAARKILEPLAARRKLDAALRFAVLNDLGYVLYALHDTARAEDALKRALALTAPGSPSRLLVEENLASTYFTAGDLPNMTKHGEEALRLAVKFHGARSVTAAALRTTLATGALVNGDLPRAEELYILAIRDLPPGANGDAARAAVLEGLAVIASRRGDHDRAVVYGRQGLDLEKANLDRILAFGSEAQRLAYRSQAFPYDALTAVGDPMLLADAVLSTKGAVLESLLAERSRAAKNRSPEDRERLDDIHALRVRLMEATARGDGGVERLQGVLKREETALAKDLHVPEGAPRNEDVLADVRRELKEHEVLVEVIRYERLRSDPWYGAVVIPRDEPPVWVPLVPATAIEPLISALVQRLNGHGRGLDAPARLGDILPAMHTLHDRLWKPIAAAFPAKTESVIISPDAATHLVPWAALLDDAEHFVIERWQLTQVASGRDLLRTNAATSDKTLLAFADGTNDLPHSKREVRELSDQARSHGWQTTVLCGNDAQELRLARCHSPRILHIATHGAVLESGIDEGRLSANPMYRGVLLLAGGKVAADAWKHGTILPVGDDGIVTAEEVAGLDLQHTWLTVLSACSSGDGEPLAGEGILGLRRAFMLAGVENLLFSLWSVPDEAGEEFMGSFYERLFAGKEPDRAFIETQAATLKRWRKIDSEDAVRRAGGFVFVK